MSSSYILSDNGVSSGSAGLKSSAGNDGVLVLQTANSSGTATTAVTIDTSQNVGIGTSTLNDKFNLYSATSVYQRFQNSTTGTGATDGFQIGNDASAAYIWNYEAVPTIFATSNTERARIDSSGNLLVGATSSSRKFVVEGSNTVTSFIHNTHNTSGDYAMIMALGGSNTNNTSSHYLLCDTDNVGVRLVIWGNGNVQNINNSYGAYSDIKLKENITDATPKLADLMQVRIRNYNLIGEETKQIGVVAQELEQIFPGMVEESPDYENVTTTDDDGNELTDRVLTGTTTKSVKYSVFVPMLIKAMQEQQALITTLTERITALENK